MSKTKNPGECQSCGFTTDKLTECERDRIGLHMTEEEWRKRPTEENYKWLCDLCYNTSAGRAMDFPPNIFPDRTMLQHVNLVGNILYARFIRLVYRD